MLRKVLLFKILLLIFIPSISLSEGNYRSTVDENINKNISIQFIESNSTQIHIVISVGINKENGLLLDNRFREFSYISGSNYKAQFGELYHQYSLILDSKYVSDFFEILKSEQNATLGNINHLKIILTGNVNEQRVLGRFHSQWAAYKVESKLPNISNLLTTSFEPELQKNRTNYWHHLIAALINCNRQDLSDIEFIVSEAVFLCKRTLSPEPVSEGEIANLKSNLYESLKVQVSSLDSFMVLLPKFRMANAIDEINAFIDELPDLSIEQISKIYHQNLQVIHVAEKPNENIKESLPNTKIDLIDLVLTEKPVWAFGIVINKPIDVCGSVNCQLLNKQISFEYYELNNTLLFFEFTEENQAKYMNLINDQVIKPLLLSINDLSVEDVEFYAFASEKILPFSELSKSISKLQRKEQFKVKKVDKVYQVLSDKETWQLCFSNSMLEKQNWLNQLLLGYKLNYSLYTGQSHLLNTTNSHWDLLFANCLPQSQLKNNSNNAIEDLLQKIKIIASSIDEDEFEQLKKALLNRVNLLDSEGYRYQMIKAYIGLELKNYLMTELSSMSYREFQYYINQILSKPSYLLIYRTQNRSENQYPDSL